MRFPYIPPIFLSSLIVVILSFSNNGSYLLFCFEVKILRERWKKTTKAERSSHNRHAHYDGKGRLMTFLYQLQRQSDCFLKNGSTE